MRKIVLSAAALALITATTLSASARIILAEVCSDDQSLVLVTTVTDDGVSERGVCRTAPVEHQFEIVEADGNFRTFLTELTYNLARSRYLINNLGYLLDETRTLLDETRTLLD